MCSDSEKNMSAYADQNHAPSLTCVRLEFFSFPQDIYKSIADTRDRNDLYLLLLQAFHAYLPNIVNIIEMYPYKNKPSDTELLSHKQKLLKDAISATSEKLQSLKTAQEKDSEIPIVLEDFLLKNFNIQTGYLLDDSGKRTIVSSQSFISRQWWEGKQL